MAKTKKGSFSKIRAVVALIIIAVLTVGICCMGYASRDDAGKWFGNILEPSTWHWSDKTDETGNATSVSANSFILNFAGDGAELKGAKIPVEAYAANGISANAATAYTLSATMSPSNVSDTRCNWSVNWENSASEWAQGKDINDYVTLSDTVSTSVNVSFMQAFGEKIIITASSVLDSDITATCTVDYARRVESYIVRRNIGSYAELGTQGKDNFAYNASTYPYGLVYDVVLSDTYTLDKVTNSGMKMRMTEELELAIEAHFRTDLHGGYYELSSYSGSYIVSFAYVPLNTMFGITSITANDTDLEWLYKILVQVENHFVLETSVSNGYGQEITKNYYINLSPESIAVKPNGVEIDPPELVV